MSKKMKILGAPKKKRLFGRNGFLRGMEFHEVKQVPFKSVLGASRSKKN